MMKRSTKVAWIIMITIIFIMPTISWFFVKENIDDENVENRILNDRPIFDFSNVYNYPREYEDYYNDNLPYRNLLIQCDSILNYFLFHTPSVETVIIGKNDWLFYDAKRNNDGDTLADLNGDNLFTQEELQVICENISKAKDSLNKDGIQFVLFIAPNKERVYQEYMPRQYQTVSQKGGDYRAEQLIRYLNENSDLEVIFPYFEIREAMKEYSEYDFYHHNDTHWNSLGAYVGTRTLLERLNIFLPPLSEAKIEYSSRRGGDLAQMLNMSDILDGDFDYAVNALPKVNYTTINEDWETEFRYISESINEEKIMIIRDSYATAMVPYIAPSFRETVMPKASYYSKDLIEQEKPDIVVYETVERYLGNLLSYEIY